MPFNGKAAHCKPRDAADLRLRLGRDDDMVIVRRRHDHMTCCDGASPWPCGLATLWAQAGSSEHRTFGQHVPKTVPGQKGPQRAHQVGELTARLTIAELLRPAATSCLVAAPQSRSEGTTHITEVIRTDQLLLGQAEACQHRQHWFARAVSSWRSLDAEQHRQRN